MGVVAPGIVRRVARTVVGRGRTASSAPVDGRKQDAAHHGHQERCGRELLLHRDRRPGRKAPKQRERRDHAADAETERHARQQRPSLGRRADGGADQKRGAEGDQEEDQWLEV